MSVDLTAGIVRILTSEGATTGTGFVVTDEGLIATCAHVVAAAGAGPGDSVRVVFHSTGEGRDARIEPEWWCASDAEDVAILRLEGSLPESVAPLLLGSSGGTSSHPFKTFGFPAVKDVDGIWGYGNLGDPTTEAGRSLLQLTGTTEVTTGFSGAPVLDIVTRRVVGMVTTMTIPDRYGRLAETAFITPTETLRAVCPELQISNLCPYQGLATFTEANAEFFFGREKLVADLVDHLRGSPRFLAVVGPSGSGKSSVVQAGLFPALRQGEVPGSAGWYLLTFRPGADPFAALSAVGLNVPNEGNLQTAVRAFLEVHPQVKRLVFFADQFEEVFVLCPEPMRELFLKQLLALLESDLPVTVTLALRADFYGYLLRYQPWVDWLRAGQVNVPPMGSEELKAAIQEPALRLGLSFEPGLVKVIAEEAGEVEHPLPLLESALTQLWEKRDGGVLTHAAYQAVGRVTGAIGQWAEDTYSALPSREQSMAQRVFTRLVHYGEGGAADTRQRQSLPELVARSEEQETLHRLVRRLADRRLLVTGGEPGAETAEIIHDALLREWGRLRRWVTGQREFYLWRQRLDERLQEWESKGQDEGALLRGALLAEAERYAVERSDDLNPDEREYIQDSIALRERERVAQERLRRRITTGLAVGLLVALMLAVFAGVQWRRAEEQRQIAAARQLAAQSQMVLDITSAGLIRGSLLAIESLRHYPTLEGDQALRQSLALLPRPLTQMRHKRSVETIAFSPDGRWLATGSADGTARVWEAGTGQEVAQMAHEWPVETVAFSPDGRWLATGSGDIASGRAQVWEAATGQEITRMTHGGAVKVVAFSPDGRWLATGSADGTARVWEAGTGQEVAQMAHEWSVETIAFSPDGRWLATGSADGTARVWEAATGQEVTRMVHEDTVWVVAFSPDGRWLATGNGDIFRGGAQIWEAATGQEVARMAHREAVKAVTFSPNGHWLATGSSDSTARVSEAATGQEMARVTHKKAVEIVSFSPDGRWMVSASGDKLDYPEDYENAVRVWDIVRGREVARLPHEEPVLAISFSPNGRWLATGCRDGTVQVWEMTMGYEVSRMTHGWPVDAVAFSPDGDWLATGSQDATARVWEVATGDELIRMEPEQVVFDVAFSPDGRWLATASRVAWTDSGEARVWDVVTGEEIARMANGSPVLSVAFSPDGRWLATGAFASPVTVWEAATGGQIGEVACCSPTDVAFSPDGHWLAIGGLDGGAGVWDVVTGEEIARMGHGYTAWAVTFSPDGRWLATGSADGTARVWKAATGREVTRMVHGQNSAVESVAFSPDGRWLATGSWDGTARVWEVTTGQEVTRMVYEDVVWAVTFSPDGRWLATGGADGTARVLLWRMEDLVAEVCARLPRNLTQGEWRMYLGNESYHPICPNLPVPEE